MSRQLLWSPKKRCTQTTQRTTIKQLYTLVVHAITYFDVKLLVSGTTGSEVIETVRKFRRRPTVPCLTFR